jgi:hypothetical protein
MRKAAILVLLMLLQLGTYLLRHLKPMIGGGGKHIMNLNPLSIETVPPRLVLLLSKSSQSMIPYKFLVSVPRQM